MNYKLRELCDEKSKEYDSLILKTKPEWNTIKSEKISEIKKICENYGNKFLDGVYFQEDIQKIDINNLKKRIIETPDLFKDVESCKKQEINNEIDKIIKEEIIVKQNSLQKSLPNWSDIKMQLIDNIKFKMSIKSKNNLDYTNLDNVINVLCQYIETCSDIFNRCKTEEKKNEIRIETKNIAREIGQEYISKKQKEENKKRLEEQRRIEEEMRREQDKKFFQNLFDIMNQNIQREREQREQREREQREREQREQREREQREKTNFSEFFENENIDDENYGDENYGDENIDDENNDDENNDDENYDDENYDEKNYVDENNDDENNDDENYDDENYDDENYDDENNDDENNDDQNNDDENNDDDN